MPNEAQPQVTAKGVTRRTFVGGAVGATAIALAAPSAHASPPAATGGESYVIRWRRPRQTILGLGFEIQSDSIGSGNNGLPDAKTSVPHDLVQGERDRLYSEMLRGGGQRGFRYCRLAMGLYLRGLTPDRKNVIGRWPEQMDELREMVERSRLDGMSVEYWSPPPGWKSNDSYIRGTLKGSDQAFLSEFADALVQDVRYLKDHGLPVKWWGLQNEPDYATPYSCCTYSPDLYYNAFRTVASRIRSTFPDIYVHANSLRGQFGRGCDAIREDVGSLALVDGWTWHRIGTDTDELLPGSHYSRYNKHRAVYNNEFEYLSWDVSRTPWYTVNTAQSIMNWMVFHDSPTWIWLHALKPTYNSEALGYSLGFWRPWDDDDFSAGHFPGLQKGHWTWNTMNWHGIAGFLRHLPWDSIRVEVDEPSVRGDQRIMAWHSPGGVRTFVVTNRAATPFTYTVDIGPSTGFTGSRYRHDTDAQSLGLLDGERLTIEVPAYSIEFWTEGENA